MMPIYLLILFVTNSYQYKIIDLEPYRYIHYMDDIDEKNNNIVIYKYQPQSEEKNIFISFLGKSIYGSFEVYLYSNLSEINYDKEGSFTNYIEIFNNYGEIEVKYEFDIYYILIKNNWFEDKYKYLSLMIYNL